MNHSGCVHEGRFNTGASTIRLVHIVEERHSVRPKVLRSPSTCILEDVRRGGEQGDPLMQTADLRACVWRGSGGTDLPPSQHSIMMWGTPLGEPVVVQMHLDKKAAQQRTFLERIPMVADLQSSWLILLHCGSASATCVLRVVEPQSVAACVPALDESIWACMRTHPLAHQSRSGRRDQKLYQSAVGVGRVGPQERHGRVGPQERRRVFATRHMCCSAHVNVCSVGWRTNLLECVKSTHLSFPLRNEITVSVWRCAVLLSLWCVTLDRNEEK